MAYRLALNVGWREDLAARREALLAKIEAADRAGVDSVWVEEAWGRDAFSLLVQAADRTERIGLATGIVNVFSRSPGALAQHFASLDELSGGRAIAGLGSSGPAVIEGLHGAPWRDPLRRTAECVRVLRALFAGEAADYGDEAPEGARGFALAFRPPRPDLPIHIAALAPRSLRQTARIADGWLPIWTPLEAVPALVRSLRERLPDGASASGRPFEVRSPGPVILTDRPEAVRAAAKEALAFYVVRMGDFYARHLERIGHGELVRAVREAWRAGGREAAAAAVPDAVQQSCAFVTADAAEARDRLAQQAEVGVTLHQADADTDDPAEAERRFRALAA